jgi:Kef-type K+ transport system membrane component KefB
MDLSSYFAAHHVDISLLVLIGFISVVSFHFGRMIKIVKLPLIIGYMLCGVMLGPSFLNVFNDNIQTTLSFLTELALGFVALGIGLELDLTSLRKLGSGLILIIFAESLGAFIVVTASIYLLTKNLPLALIFGSIAPASAPAGTVAVIREYRARGSLTKALYAVVGFDDGLGIIIFGFVAAFARNLLLREATTAADNFLHVLLIPMKEIGLSILIGSTMAGLFCLIVRKLQNPNDFLIHVFGFVLIMTGLSKSLHLSLILTNMIAGLIIINTQPYAVTDKVNKELPMIMPLLFILFFTLAGANLHIATLPSLGLLGFVYVLSRSFGLISGSWLGAYIGKVESKIKKYLGLGILSQAGVAIGLSLIVKHDFKGIGKVIDHVAGVPVTSGDNFGSIVLTTVTATCIIFEIIGPILTKIALEKAGEIGE